MYQSTSMRLPALGSAPQQMDQGTEYQTILTFSPAVGLLCSFNFHGDQNTFCSFAYYPQYLSVFSIFLMSVFL